jgi:DNA-binding response OmpR family regulator
MDGMQTAVLPIATVDVLVLDDDESVRHVVKAALVNYGYTVETAAIGPTAIELLRCLKGRLIITSAFTPAGDGLEVVVAMKAQVVPVVAMSGALIFTPEREERIARQFGATRVLAKPFRLKILIATVRDLIGDALAAETAMP